MKYLGEQENTIFVGQQTAYKGNALYNTLEYVAQEKRIEFPVAEEFQMGFCTGLSLENYVPISFYPRMDFIILSLNQMLNHLDKFELPGFIGEIFLRSSGILSFEKVSMLNCI